MYHWCTSMGLRVNAHWRTNKRPRSVPSNTHIATCVGDLQPSERTRLVVTRARISAPFDGERIFLKHKVT
jgi:hypothetical protein